MTDTDPASSASPASPDGRSVAPPAAAPPATSGVSRRQLLGAAAAGAAGFVVGGIAGPFIAPRPADTGNGAVAGSTTYPFFGPHQAGVTTPVQDHLHVAAFDMAGGTSRRDLESLLRDWSYAASRMTQGLEVSAAGAVGGDPNAAPDDTGEALDLPASGLTVTVGLGPGIFEKDGTDRYGLAERRPPGLEQLPPFPGDTLKAEASHGDLCLQVCADDPQVAVHAIRNLTRIAFGRATVRWSQLGFGRTSRTTSAQQTPRNLMGFKDGTNNILADDETALNEHVWVQASDRPAWLAGGSYLVVRKIAMRIEPWDREKLAEQERIFGRTKLAGAPLSGGEEFSSPDFAATKGSAPAIDPAAHVRLAHPSSNGGIRILRRGYNYVDGSTPNGKLDAGLLFISYQRTPDQFIALQRSLRTDLLNEYIRHVGSAIFVVPPGAAPGEYVGGALFA